MKTNEELNALKSEFDALAAKMKDLNEEELMQVTGGLVTPTHIEGWTKGHNFRTTGDVDDCCAATKANPDDIYIPINSPEFI